MARKQQKKEVVTQEVGIVPTLVLTLQEALDLRTGFTLYTLRTLTPDDWALFYTRKEGDKAYFGLYTPQDHVEHAHNHEIEANQAFHEAIKVYDTNVIKQGK